MVRVCCYKGCGVIYGEKEPLSDRRATHGLCPKHHELALRDLRLEIEKRKAATGSSQVFPVKDSTPFLLLKRSQIAVPASSDF